LLHETTQYEDISLAIKHATHLIFSKNSYRSKRSFA